MHEMPSLFAQIFRKNDFHSVFLTESILYLILKVITARSYFLLYVLNYKSYNPNDDLEKAKEGITKGKTR